MEDLPLRMFAVCSRWISLAQSILIRHTFDALSTSRTPSLAGPGAVGEFERLIIKKQLGINELFGLAARVPAERQM